MSESDPHVELAAIARSVRELLEREAAAGLADLLARDVGAGRKEAESARPVELAEAPAARPPFQGEPVRSSPKPPPVNVNLFGEPVDQPSTAGDVDRFGEFPAAPAAPSLNPVGWEERAEIAAASLPVLDEVASLARACTKCGLCESRTQAVPGVGSARSGIVFVGEAPGAEEDRKGEPFVGRAGELLTRIIEAMDRARLIPGVPLDRDSVYICNVLKCRPPENRNPLPHEIEMCSPYLERQLGAIKPRIICCLGKFAAELLVGVRGTIGALRGKTYRYRGAKLIVTYHPAACLRNPNLKRPVWEDMQLLAREYVSA